jgi:hypothetical protein
MSQEIRISLARAKQREDIACRKCTIQRETLGHILGQCSSTKVERIARHDEVKDLILNKIIEKDSNAIVTREPTLQSPEGGALKPDLVIQNKEGVFVVDVTVRHEDGEYLREGRRSKIAKYSSLLPHLKRRYNTENADVLPIVVGTRGAMPEFTINNLGKLGIKEIKYLKAISLISFRRSMEIYVNFMDYNVTPLCRRRESLPSDGTPDPP